MIVASRDVYTSPLKTAFALANADCRMGCTWLWLESVSAAETLALRWYLGEEEMVVMAVFAVRGRSLEGLYIAAEEEGGSFPVNSSFLMRSLRSSSSSQTVDGAVVDNVDSVPSARDRSVSARTRSVASDVDGWRLPRIVDNPEWRCRGSCMEERRSSATEGVRGEVSGLVRLKRLRGTPTVDRAPDPRLL